MEKLRLRTCCCGKQATHVVDAGVGSDCHTFACESHAKDFAKREDRRLFTLAEWCKVTVDERLGLRAKAGA